MKVVCRPKFSRQVGQSMFHCSSWRCQSSVCRTTVYRPSPHGHRKDLDLSCSHDMAVRAERCAQLEYIGWDCTRLALTRHRCGFHHTGCVNSPAPDTLLTASWS